MTAHSKHALLLLVISLFFGSFLVGCNAAPVPTTTPTLVVINVPTITPTTQPTETPGAPTPEEPTVIPTIMPAFPTLVPTLPAAPRVIGTRILPTTPANLTIKIFLIALNDNGKSGKKIGCGDSVVAVNRAIPTTSAPLTAALKELLSIRQQTYGASGLYNALYQSNLKVTGVTLVNKRATVNLSGTVLLGGVCDSPRFAAQIRETALQFATVDEVDVFINNTPLDKILSEKGG
jgi:hypothetical protein